MPTGTNTAKRFTPDERSAHVKAFRESGLSQTKFVEGQPFSFNTLSSWIAKESKQMAARKKKASKKTGKPMGRSTAPNGRFVEGEVASFELAPIGKGPRARVDALDTTELRALVKLQAQIIARFI